MFFRIKFAIDGILYIAIWITLIFDLYWGAVAPNAPQKSRFPRLNFWALSGNVIIGSKTTKKMLFESLHQICTKQPISCDNSPDYMVLPRRGCSLSRRDTSYSLNSVARVADILETMTLRY